MIEETIIHMVGSLGFPIFMCVWLLMRTEKIIKANTQALQELIKKIK